MTENNSHKIAQFTPLVIIMLDILCTALLLMIGSRVYSSISVKDAAYTEKTTLLNYTVNKIRSCDGNGTVSVREEDGEDVLVLSSTHGDRTYETRIGQCGGEVMELFAESDSALSLSEGVKIAECADLTFELEEENGQKLVRANADGEEILVYLRSGGQDR